MRILGLEFFEGTVSDAVDRASTKRGLIAAPSGTCFTRLRRDPAYRTAMTDADLILPDSGLMVSLWASQRGQRLNRISGLAFLKELLSRASFRTDRAVLWVLPNERDRNTALAWLQAHDFPTTLADCYVAPMYGKVVEDPVLLARIEAARPNHIVIALSGGVQEKLGFYLRNAASQRPAIHCIGGALGFVTGYQVAIPSWADRLFLGWLFRLVSNPRRFLPRALSAFALPGMIRKYGEQLPPMDGVAE